MPEQSSLFRQVFHAQNHRVGDDGRDHSGSSAPTPLPRQDHPRAHGTGLRPDGSEIPECLQRGRLLSLSGQSVPVHGHLHSESLPQAETGPPRIPWIAPGSRAPPQGRPQRHPAHGPPGHAHRRDVTAPSSPRPRPRPTEGTAALTPPLGRAHPTAPAPLAGIPASLFR